MKKTLITMMLAAMSLAGVAQVTDSTDVRKDTVERGPFQCVLEQMPEYPGGKNALIEYLSKNVKYPELASQYGVEGRVVMQFVVDVDGSLKDISAKDCKINRFNTTKFSQETEARQQELKKQFALLFAKEGARVIRKMPRWEPGRINGEAKRVRYTLPITFSIPNK